VTLVVGVDLGYYALFAGDDRETVFDGENLEPRAVAGTGRCGQLRSAWQPAPDSPLWYSRRSKA